MSSKNPILLGAVESKQRGSKVDLEPDWLKFLSDLWIEVKQGRHPKAGGTKTNIVEFGAMLAAATGRVDPWADASISRFLNGTQLSDELLLGFVTFFDLPYPILSAKSVEEIEWFNLVRTLGELGEEGRTKLAELRTVVIARIRVIKAEARLREG